MVDYGERCFTGWCYDSTLKTEPSRTYYDVIALDHPAPTMMTSRCQAGATMMPSVNQIEVQPWWHEDDLFAVNKKLGIVTQGPCGHVYVQRKGKDEGRRRRR